MKALLLAAGYATRLYPLTLDKPKALLPVGQKPLLSHIIDKIARLGKIDEAFLVSNHKFFGAFCGWAAAQEAAFPVDIIDDGTLSNDDRLGAIGDIDFAIKTKAIKDGLLVIGADNLFEDALKEFLDFSFKKASNTIALFDLADTGLAKKYGVVSVDKTGRITDFQEKPAHPKSTLISTCIYYFPSEKLGLFARYLSGCEKKDASGHYIKWLAENDEVYGYVLKGKWYDIGDMESYKKAQEDFK